MKKTILLITLGALFVGFMLFLINHQSARKVEATVLIANTVDDDYLTVCETTNFKGLTVERYWVIDIKYIYESHGDTVLFSSRHGDLMETYQMLDSYKHEF